MDALSKLLSDQGLALFLVILVIVGLGYSIPKIAIWANKWLERFYTLFADKIQDLSQSDVSFDRKLIKLEYDVSHALNLLTSIEEIQRWQQEKIQDIMNYLELNKRPTDPRNKEE